MGSFVFLYLSVLNFISTVAGDSSVKVTQLPKRVTVIGGTNINFICIFSSSQNGSGVDVQWKKEGEHGYLDTIVDSRKIFGVKEKGSSYFQLLNVSFQDSGVYRCTVSRQRSIIGTGPGSQLIVQVPPTPIRIFSNSTEQVALVCETTAFYPKYFTLTWHKDGIQITRTSGIKVEETVTSEKQTSGELYKVSSSIEDTQSVQKTSVYTCLVSHATLKTSAIATYTIPKPDAGSGNKNHHLQLGGYAAGGCVFLILLIIIGNCYRLKKKNGSKGNLTQSGNHEDQMGEGVAGDNVAYVTLDLRNSNKTPRPKQQEERTVYAQTKRGAAADKLTYAELDLTRSKQTKKAEPSDKNLEYAEVNIRKYKAVTVMES